MPASSLIAVLAAALLHASWNLMLKSSSERLVTGAGQLALAGLAFLPVLIWRGFPTEALPYLLVSGVVQVGYMCMRWRPPTTGPTSLSCIRSQEAARRS